MRAASMAANDGIDFNFMVLEKQHFAYDPSNIKCIFSSILVAVFPASAIFAV